MVVPVKALKLQALQQSTVKQVQSQCVSAQLDAAPAAGKGGGGGVVARSCASEGQLEGGGGVDGGRQRAAKPHGTQWRACGLDLRSH